MDDAKLMNCRTPRPDAYYYLICFPWAGGGSNFYANWGKNICENVEVHAVTLPGRESRFNDPCISDVDTVINSIVNKIKSSFSDKPLIFFGHSLGALLAFEVARLLTLKHDLEPRRLYLSGISAPHSEARRKRKTVISNMSDEEFIKYLGLLGGTPSEILNNKEMMDMFLPALRADYTLVNTYDYFHDGHPIFTCPISFFDGEKDMEHDIDGWRELTFGDFTMTKLPGGHFYLKDPACMKKLQDTISKDFSGLSEIC